MLFLFCTLCDLLFFSAHIHHSHPPLVLVQLEMQACDNGCPARCGSQSLQVYINRNLNAPFFSPVSYPTTISEDTQFGSTITRVSAFDSDFAVSIFSSFFYMFWLVVFLFILFYFFKIFLCYCHLQLF
jgi:hypothetical protein